MSQIVISIENLSKSYQLGVIGTRTFKGDLQRWWARQLGRPDPLRKVDEPDHGNRQGEIIWALNNINFQVRQGEVLGIIGRNGAGKSTLLKILSRVTTPTSGIVNIKGHIASLLEVGTGFHPDLTGRENIYLNGAIMGMSRVEVTHKFDEIVDFSGVEKFIDTPVKRYSSGMYVRLAFAVAAHLDPEILVVDEVLAVGDAEFQKKSLGKMNAIAREGRTVLFVSHNISAIQRLCPRTILLKEGCLDQDGDTDNVISKYLAIGLEQLGERIWKDPKSAPGDDIVRLKAIRALNADLQVSSKFSVRDAWHLEVDFDVLKPGHNVNVNIYVYNTSGHLLFVTGDFQTAEWQNRARPVGVHRSRCNIPGDFLNDGMLRILIALVTPPAKLHAMDEDALTISIIDDLSTSGARGHYAANWPGGVVRPLLKWEYEYKPEV